MPVTRRKSDADLSESLRHEADAGPVVMPNYTLLSRADWERVSELLNRIERLDLVELYLRELIASIREPIETVVDEKVAAPPHERIAEIEDFMDFIRQRVEERSLRRDFAALSRQTLPLSSAIGSTTTTGLTS
jgi:hypothetical protein